MLKKKISLALMCVLGAAVIGCSSETGQPGAAEPKVYKIYVGAAAPSGFDETQGDIGAAVAAARDARASGAVGVEIVLADGVYRLTAPVVLTSEDSGVEGGPLVIRAEHPRQAMLSGARALAPQWRDWQGGIVVADVSGPSFDGLFVNGEKQMRARYPNYDPDVRVYNGYAEDALAPARAGNWSRPETGYFHALHSGRWGGWHYRILGVDEDGGVRLSEGVGNNRPSAPHETFRFVENILEELDAPGEWFFDEAEGKLYFFPPEGLDLAAAVVAGAYTENLIELRGAADNPVRFVEIDGLGFAETAMTFMKTTEPLLRSDWMIHRGGAILFDGVEDSAVRNSVFKDLGGNAVFISGYNRRVVVAGNEIVDAGAGGVNVVGRVDAVRSPSMTYAAFTPYEALDLTEGPKSEDYPSAITIEDNLIHRIGIIEKQVAGVQISMASGVTVRANSIYETPRAGINIGDGNWGGHVLENNDVFDTVLETGDHGAFNSWGRDRFWLPDREAMDALVKAHPELIFLDARETVVIRNNRFQSDHGWDIDLDDGASNYRIYNNVCLSGGLKLREGFKRVVENNILINNSFHPHVWFEDSGDVFRRNIVMTDYKPIWVEHWGEEIDFNLFPSGRALEKSRKLGLDEHSVSASIAFVDPEKGDYRVPEGSPALALGFENFPMDFGVRSAWLKEKARAPKAPDLFLAAALEDADQSVNFLGAEIRSVKTEGDKSAFGLPDISGVIVMSVEEGSLAARSGLKPKDVIVSVFDEWGTSVDDIPDVPALLSSHQARKWMGQLKLKVIRNQTEKELSVDLTAQ